MNWIKARLNKDNFWNIMFWLGMTIGMAISEYFSKNKIIAEMSFWITLFCIPFVTKLVQNVKFDNKYGFFNSNGKSLKDSIPKNFGFAIFAAVGFTAVVGLIMDKSNFDLSSSISVMLLWSILFLFLTLYFIYKNCPISILFNKNIVSYTNQERIANLLSRVPGLNENTQSVTHISYHFHQKENIDRNQ